MQPVPALLTTLLSLPLVISGQSQLLRSVSSYVDEGNTCHCVVHLTNYLSLLQPLEQLQNSAQELIGKYEQELFRVSKSVYTNEDQDNQILDVRHRTEPRNPSTLIFPYNTSTFNLLHLELEKAQKLVTQLKDKKGVDGAEGLLHQLQSQVMNASLILKLLTESDPCNFSTLQQEVDVLEGQLSKCEREREQQQASRYSGLPLPPGSCAHKGLLAVSRPFVVGLNWKGFSHKAGSWGRDSAPNSTSSLYWVAPLQTDGRYFDYYQLYKSYNDLVLLKNYKEWFMGYGDGSGNTVYENFMYFNYYGTSDMAKVDLSSNTLVLQRPLSGATYNNRFSYAGVPWKALHFAGDEKGLWVLYATEESKGNLVVSRLNASSLEVEETWHTSQYKPALSGAFMACGVLYALRSLNIHQEEIFYAFDTTTGQEYHISILLDKVMETLQGINYCPSDHRLYVYSEGFLVYYDLTFLTPTRKPPKSLAKWPFGVHALSKSVKPIMPSKP
ncbi:olfactomedin-4 [Tupaia chinensis]|uniref:olfactomedin-4 n=1 Tax=Tupaia chinensis TaxID=246437 RepID=UPI0003C8D8DD|nr:olfactomedin-4 [Tupaia chinensis]